MAMARFCLRTLPGVDSPAIAAVWPTVRGDSVVLDALGHPLLSTPAYEEGVYSATLHKPALDALRTSLPFQQDRDQFSFS